MTHNKTLRRGMIATFAAAMLVASALLIASRVGSQPENRAREPVMFNATLSPTPHHSPLARTADPSPTGIRPPPPIHPDPPVHASFSYEPGITVDITYAAPTSDGLRLFNEMHVLSVPNVGSKTLSTAAIRVLLRPRSARDPEFVSLWPRGTKILGESTADPTGHHAVLTVNLHTPSTYAASDDVKRLAVEQLVWTADAAALCCSSVRLLFDGSPRTTLWGSAPVGGEMHAGEPDADAAVARVNIESGAKITGQPFDIFVKTSDLTDVIHVCILDQQGNIVFHASAKALQEIAYEQEFPYGDTGWHVRHIPPPGDYTVVVYTLLWTGVARVLDHHAFTIAGRQ